MQLVKLHQQLEITENTKKILEKKNREQFEDNKEY